MFRAVITLFLGLLISGYSLTAYAEDDNTPPAITAKQVQLEYPRFDGFGVTGDKMASTIADEIDSFAVILRQPEYGGTVGYKVEYNCYPLLSITVNEMYYRYHAAHPMTYLKAFTFNTDTGKTLRLGDLFRKDADYIGRLNKIMTARIASEKIPLLDGSFNGVKDDQEFYLIPGKIVVYYQLYEYTPYAYGFLEFPISYEVIADLLKPDILAVLAAGQKGTSANIISVPGQ